MSGQPQMLSELLRPQQLSDLTLSQGTIDRLQTMVDKGSVMNMLFYGKPGVGKTSAARALMNSFHGMEINGSEVTGADYVRDRINGFAITVSLYDTKKLCFIDDAEYVPRSAQAALRMVIEKRWKNCRFILAVNDVSKLLPAIRSRLKEICFDIAAADRPHVQERLLERYKTKLAEVGMEFDVKRLTELVGIYFPDFRSIANQIEFEFA
jgi:DNA polymerase III delta prime subunit